MPQEYESKTIKVYGDKFAKARSSIPAYERVLHTRLVTITCAKCGKTVKEHHYPGAKPKYCAECRAGVRREQVRDRVRRLRDRNAHD